MADLSLVYALEALDRGDELDSDQLAELVRHLLAEVRTLRRTVQAITSDSPAYRAGSAPVKCAAPRSNERRLVPAALPENHQEDRHQGAAAGTEPADQEREAPIAGGSFQESHYLPE
jgi:hypothetical protein